MCMHTMCALSQADSQVAAELPGHAAVHAHAPSSPRRVGLRLVSSLGLSLHQHMPRRRVNLLVVTAGGARDASAGAAERYWRDAHAPGGAAAPAGDAAAEPPPAAFEVAYVPSMEDAHRALQAALSALRRALARARRGSSRAGASGARSERREGARVRG